MTAPLVSRKKSVDAKLVTAIKKLMDDVMKEPVNGEESKYSLTDRMKVIDRFIKIEAIRLDVQEDSSEGSFFKRDKGGADNADE